MAREAFKDAFAIDWIDKRQGGSEHRLNMLAMVEDRLLHASYTLWGIEYAYSRPETRNLMSDADTTMKTAKYDWSRADAMTDSDVHTAAMDPMLSR